MEELLVYSFLLYEGLASDNDYQNCLDALFLDNPTNPDLLELEIMASNLKESIIYIRNHFEHNSFDCDVFGRFLMNKLKENYYTMELKSFADKMYSLWKILPTDIQHDQPFVTLCYADDPLSWGNEQQSRELYEHMLNYYDCFSDL